MASGARSCCPANPVPGPHYPGDFAFLNFTPESPHGCGKSFLALLRVLIVPLTQTIVPDVAAKPSKIETSLKRSVRILIASLLGTRNRHINTLFVAGTHDTGRGNCLDR